MPRIAVIGGSGFESLLQGSRDLRIGTPNGPVPLITVGLVGKEEVAFLPRHGPKHDLPPHKINYRANMRALKQLGIERIIATNAVGSINTSYNPGDLAIPEDIIDMTKSRTSTFFEGSPVTHIDVSQPYCPELRKILIDCTKGSRLNAWGNSVMVTTEGPRYETPAEIRMLRTLGGDIVGMTGAPETFLARELGICYSTVCFISNRAAGQQDKLSHIEVIEMGKRVMPEVTAIIRKSIEIIPMKRSCPCAKAIDQGQV